jgi:hypothetical protein
MYTLYYAIPVESLCVGAFVGYRSLGTTAIGCEIWVVPGSTALRDPGVQRLRRRTAMNGERMYGSAVAVLGWNWCKSSGDDLILKALMTTSRQRSCGREGGGGVGVGCGGDHKHGLTL